MAANGVKIYENWYNAIHEMGAQDIEKAKDLSFRILDYAATRELNTDGLTAVDKDWLVSVSKGIDKADEVANRTKGRPRILDLDERVQKLLDSGVTVGTKIAEQLGVSKDTVYGCDAWIHRKKDGDSKKVVWDF